MLTVSELCVLTSFLVLSVRLLFRDHEEHSKQYDEYEADPDSPEPHRGGQEETTFIWII